MVIGDLAEMGYDCEWCIVSASDCGAPHQRDRFWLLAWNTHSKYVGKEQQICRGETSYSSGGSEEMAHSQKLQRDGSNDHSGISVEGQQVSESGNGSGQSDVAYPNVSQRQRRGIPGRVYEEYPDFSSRSSNGDACQKLAYTSSERQQGSGKSWFGSDPAEKREGETDHAFAERVGHIWGIESPVGRVADGVAARVDRLKAIGNGQVPIVAATAWRVLSGN